MSEFNSLLTDKNYLNLASKVFHKYRGFRLSRDDKREIFLSALWYSVKTWDESKSKLTTYFYNNLNYKILDWLKPKKGIKFVSLHHPEEVIDHRNDNFNDIIGELSQIQQNFLRKHYVSGMTYKEIGLENGYSEHEVGVVIKKAKDRLKRGV